MSAYPGSIDDDATLYVPADSFSPPKTLSTTLAANALSTDTDIQIVASVGTLGAPTAYGILSIADELIIYTGHSEVGSVYKVTGCTRGAFGTAAVGHLAGVIAKWRYVAEFDLALQAAIQAIETTLGITGAFNFLQDTGGNGLAARTAQGVTAARTITAGRGVDVTNGTGVSGDPTIARKAAVNAQTGTSYTIADGDGGKLVTGTNASAQAYTLPQAGASSLFVSGWFCDIENRGAGALTITPTTSTVDGAATLVLTTNQGCRLFSDGTNYFTQRGIGGGYTPTFPPVSVFNGPTRNAGSLSSVTGSNQLYGLGISLASGLLLRTTIQGTVTSDNITDTSLTLSLWGSSPITIFDMIPGFWGGTYNWSLVLLTYLYNNGGTWEVYYQWNGPTPGGVPTNGLTTGSIGSGIVFTLEVTGNPQSATADLVVHEILGA